MNSWTEKQPFDKMRERTGAVNSHASLTTPSLKEHGMAEPQPILALPALQLTNHYRQVIGFPGYYLRDDGTCWTQWVLSRDSRLRLVWTAAGVLTRKPTTINRFGYHLLRIKREWGQVQCVLSKAMLLAFVGPPPRDGMCCCHNDGDKNNNAISNLRWDTRSNNELDKLKHGTSNRGERNGMAIATEEQVKEVLRLWHEAPRSKTGMFRKAGTRKRIAEQVGLSVACISPIVYGDNWRHLQPDQKMVDVEIKRLVQEQAE